jgi:phosphatidylethanolamine N-methyltransferase
MVRSQLFPPMFSLALTALPLPVDRPITLDFTSVRQCLMHIVTLCLDSDPSLVPLCSKISEPGNKVANGDSPEIESRDPDDFRFWSERQAKRICRAIKEALDVDYAPEVVVAHANLSALAHRILLSKKL